MIKFNLLLGLNVLFACVLKEDECWQVKRRKRCIAEENYLDQQRTTYETHTNRYTDNKASWRMELGKYLL